MDGIKDGFALGEPEKFDTSENEAKTPEQLEAELKLNPEVLTEALKTIVDSFWSRSLAYENRAVTSPIRVDVGGDSVEVFASYVYGPFSSQNIYIQDPETGESRLLFNFNYRFNGDTNKSEFEITDGSNRDIETVEELMFVRQLIDKMRSAYFEQALAKADGLDVNGHLTETVDARIAELEADLISLRALKERLIDLPKVHVFHVAIDDSWVNEGGHNLDEIIAASSLSEAIGMAVEKFKKLNNRNDVQSSGQRVSLVVGKDSRTEVGIPHEVYAPLFKALGTYDGEQALIERMSTDRS